MSSVQFLNNNNGLFVVNSGSEIGLFNLKQREQSANFNYEEPKSHIPASFKFFSQSDCSITHLSSEVRYQYIKCIAPSFHTSGKDIYVAAGQQNGKVAVINFQPDKENHIEFTPRQQRPCLCLSWNNEDKNLLAMGYDKNKMDHCITVWDFGKGSPSEHSIVNLIGLSETAHSICWDKRTLIAGMSQKYIKMMDLRQNPVVVTSTNTRAVHGLTISPNSKCLVSYIDNVVNLWDLRKFTEPVNHFQLQNNISQLSWCPTKSSVLMCLQRDSKAMNLIDLHWSGTEPEQDAHFIKRVIMPFDMIDNKYRHGLLSRTTSLDFVSWNPQHQGRVMILSNYNSSNLLCDFQVPDRVNVVWDKNNKLWGTSTGNKINEFLIDSPPSTPTDELQAWGNNLNGNYEDEDVADLMQRRVHNSYGQYSELDKNSRLALVSRLFSVWQLLGQMHKADCFLGLKAILGVIDSPNGGESSISQSIYEFKTWSDFPTSGSIKVYRSEQRDFAQLVCGWNFNKGNESGSNVYIEELCKKKKYTRAAMLACFGLRVRYAIDILGRGADEVEDSKSSLRMSAIALSGFNVDKSGIWRSQCSAAQKQITDPHLRAIFSFLADSDTYNGVLTEKGVSISDRMAFACSFLADNKLSEYVKYMIEDCTEHGDLNGLLVTGATLDGISLMQSYVDCSDDVQTVALIGSRILPSDLLTDKRMQCWVACYRDLLDYWGLWEKRASFDIDVGNHRTPAKSPKSVFLLCSFCGKSVSAAIQEDARLRQAQPNKLSSCPNCRKPLPRCSLCLLHMGTTTTSASFPAGLKSKPFQKWFSWCQTCRHGGHTEHLADWFKTHTECPVTCCNCKCFAIDLPIPKQNEQIQHFNLPDAMNRTRIQ